ncbi:nucleotidyltransferase and HEPN domain-containing protein [Rhizobium sp. SL42]|uniref:nucleotidyltransferase and HEPN domain-containing protein n=1 Tax=Rhizobium sp. SL42 TaxID=2806346 RepID=UPI001F2AE2F8|nr:nucleotidyltransferase and HEPN domain-containing protein [Rhizobium sp. SL42]UJW77680.1 HEPN domain-containing protein [Rhizobium sp. SL42]
MKSSLEHLPEKKQRELARVVEIIEEEFADALSGAESDFKKRGRILKIILFGSYARGTWVDEPHTMKGYRSDYDILVIVNTGKLADRQYWDKAEDRLLWDPGVKTPVGLIVHGLREVNKALKDGQYFFAEIRREGIVLHEIDDEPLAEPQYLTADQAYKLSTGHFTQQLPATNEFAELAKIAFERGWQKRAAFLLHQAVETAYSCMLLTLTNYSPASHNLKFLRGLAEGLDRELVDIWPRDQHRFTAWYNVLNEAYVKARYSDHFEISDEALSWLIAKTQILQQTVEEICRNHLALLEAKIR